MYRYNAYCLDFSSEIELSECNPAVSEADDFQISITDLIRPKLEVTTIHRRGIMAHTAIDSDGALWLHWDGVATYKATGGTLLEVHPLTNDPNLLSLFTVSEALGLLLFQRKNFLLHASAVKVGGEGWVFMGMPGAGKSTTCAAFVKAGCQLLSDDLTAIVFNHAGTPFINPAYPQLKIWENTVNGLGYDKKQLVPVSEGVNKYALAPSAHFDTTPVPLSRMYFLHRDESPAGETSLSAMEVPTETLKHFPMPNQFLTASVLQQYFRQSILCAREAGFFRLQRPDGFAELEKWVQHKIRLAATPKQLGPTP